jgi:tetratricopeptide (TPR) repeat protein
VGRPIHPPNSVLALDFSPDCRRLAIGDYDNQVRLWDTATGDPDGPPLAMGNIVSLVAFRPDGKILAVGMHTERTAGRDGIGLIDVATRRLIGRVARHQPFGYSEQLVWAERGRVLVSLSPNARELMTIDGESGRVIARASDFQHAPSLIAPSPGGTSILIGMADGALEFRDATTLKRIGSASRPPDRFLLGAGVTSVAFSPDGQFVAAGDREGSLRLWDIASGTPIGPALYFDRFVTSLAFSRDGRRLHIITADSEVRTLSVPDPAVGPPDRLALRLEVATGLGLRGNQTVEVLSDNERTRAAQELQLVEPRDPAILSPFLDVDWHQNAARLAEKRGQWFTARFHIERLLHANAEDGILRTRRALALLFEGRAREAEVDLTRALASESRERTVDLLIHRAEDARQNGRLDAAVWMLDRAIAARDGDWQLHADRAELHGLLGNVADRNADRRRAVALAADSFYLGRIADEAELAGRLDEASRLRRLALDRLGSHENHSLLESLVGEAVRLGNLRRAGDLPAIVATGLHPQRLDAIYLNALALLSKGDVSGYRALCRDALSRVRGEWPASACRTLVQICVLGPNSSDDCGCVLALAEKALAGSRPEERPAALSALGAALLRAGRPTDALARLHEALGTGARALDRIYLALAHAALGDCVSARLELSHDLGLPTRGWQSLEASLLYREAVEMAFDAAFPVDPFLPVQQRGAPHQ